MRNVYNKWRRNTMTQNEYKHISIEEDEEEEVFVVGAAAAPAEQAVRVTQASPSAQVEAVAQVAGTVQEASVQAAVPASVQQAAQATPTPSKTNSAEQTLDDLDAEPMSLLQKIIIAAAVVGVIVLVAYLVMHAL